MATLNFDANTVEPAAALDPVPAGWYNVKIVESELKPTSSGKGAMLVLTEQIIDGQFAGRKLWDRLNLQNENLVTVEIAQKTLSAICHATGVMQVQDSAQLHGLPMMAKVTVRAAGPGNDGKNYDASNEIKGYKPVENVQPAGVPQGFGTAPQGFAPPVAQGAPAGWGQPTPPATPAPVAPPTPSYKEGDIVNGHQLTNGQWIPYTPPAPVPPAPGGWTPPAQPPQQAAPPAQTAPPAPPTPPAPTGAPPWAQPRK
jgi:hypothetical protein